MNNLRAKIQAVGYSLPDNIQTDKIVRFSTNGGNKNGWYRVYLNPNGSMACVIGDWQTGTKETIFCTADGKGISKTEQEQFSIQIKQAAEKQKQERIELHRKAALEAQDIWDRAKPASPEHPYLKKKQVKSYGLRQAETALLLPVYNISGNIMSLQRIYPDGDKRFLSDGKTKGGFFKISGKTDIRYLCEGYVTGATIHKATEQETIVAFNSGNLKAVAATLDKKYPDSRIVIVGDNDLKTKERIGKNPGKIAAVEAARLINASVCLCPVDSDFNDLMVKEGIEAVQQALNKTYKEELTTETAVSLLDDILSKKADDPGAVFEPKALDAFAYLSRNDKPAYMRLRAKFKKIKDVSVCEIDKSVKGESGGDQDQCKASDIIEFIKSVATFLHDHEKNSFMLLNANDHEELYAVGSTVCDRKIQHLVYLERQESMSEQVITTVNASLSCFGLFDGQEEDIYLRAGRNENSYYIDLCDDQWKVVQINHLGWQILNRSPVKFRRTQTMQPIIEPDKTPDLNALWKFCNVPESDRIFILAFILECWRPETQKPVLELTGIQGSGKSQIAEILRDLIDPNSVNLRARPKQIEDIFISAANNWLVNYNNLSHLSSGMQDALCIVGTGGGYASRQLYTNLDEVAVNVLRPVIINGISSLVTAQDLVDRAIHIDVPELLGFIPAHELRKMYEKDKPKILAGLFDLFSRALKILPKIGKDGLPRMADFTLLGESISQAMGRKPGLFVKEYHRKRGAAIRSTLDNSCVGVAILNYFQDSNETIEGKYIRDVLSILEKHKPAGETWVKTPKGLADQLRRLKPGLKKAGINVEFHKRDNKGISVTIKHFPSSGTI
ncbi:MAG: toprim domain-containing protein [Desulfobacterales bacterium]|nr:toprim domain-containing protein [Desulfobacterales bacterium]